MDLSIFDLSTLDRMKRDAIKVARDYDMTIDRVIAARHIVIDIDAELDRRIEWVDGVIVALATIR